MKYYEFYPLERSYYIPIIVKVETSNTQTDYLKKVLQDFIQELGFHPGEFQHPVEHLTLDSATARDRGCEFYFQSGKFIYQEKQGFSNPMNYMDMYMYFNGYPSNRFGDTFAPPKIIEAEVFSEYTKTKGFSIKSIVPPKKPPDFDGVYCRHHLPKPVGIYMAEPDGIYNDGMVTCYRCRERLKSLKAWPPNKEKEE